MKILKNVDSYPPWGTSEVFTISDDNIFILIACLRL